ncbi:hypothetical protein GEMRC1_006806 [Eukaryota sp. GEM-RC1]
MGEADAVIVVSRYTKESIAKNYNVSPQKIHVVHNGVVLIESEINGFRCRHAIPENKKVVLFVGRLAHQKGVAHFLEICRQLLQKSKHYCFVVAGTGPLETWMKTQL